MSLFSDNIRALRVKHKISQEKVAESLMITRGRYVKYEDGTSEAPYKKIKKIAVTYKKTDASIFDKGICVIKHILTN